MPEHIRAKCTNRDCNGCVVCNCFVCNICLLLEGALTTDCPGVTVSHERTDEIYAGKLDYRDSDGGWTLKCSPHSPAWWHEKVIIRSHDLYWKENACGYTAVPQLAGVYTRLDAHKSAGHCGPEKRISYEPVPPDHIPTLQARIKELEQRDINNRLPKIVEMANELGWDGVNNSKILDGFLREYIDSKRKRIMELEEQLENARRLQS